MVSLTFVGLGAAVVWLRRQTRGTDDGADTAALLAATIVFNWLWLMGFYNFLIGLTFLTFIVGLFFRWRENINWRRGLILSVLILIVYFSHLISFVILGGSLLVIACGAERENRWQAIFWSVLVFLPSLPFFLNYQLRVSEATAVVPSGALCVIGPARSIGLIN